MDSSGLKSAVGVGVGGIVRLSLPGAMPIYLFILSEEAFGWILWVKRRPMTPGTPHV